MHITTLALSLEKAPIRFLDIVRRRVFNMWEFERGDFEHPRGDVLEAAEARDMANVKLQEWLKEATVVYGFDNGHSIISSLTNLQMKGQTHRALLINITPIEACKHESSKVGADKSQYGFLNMKPVPMICECGARVTPVGFESINGDVWVKT